MHRISAAAMRAGLLIALVLFTAVSLFPEEAVGLFTTEHTIIREGAAYLGIVKYTYFFFAVTMILLATLRSVETVRIAFALSIMAFFINCGINYVLIYGKFGAPELGARGAAIAANSAASTLFLLVKSTAVGASSTASVVIGKTIGTGNIPLVKHYSSVM